MNLVKNYNEVSLQSVFKFRGDVHEAGVWARAASPDPGSEIRRPGVPGMLERVMVTAVVTGQRVGYPESTRALSSAGLGCETWEPCLFWMLEKACVDLLKGQGCLIILYLIIFYNREIDWGCGVYW